MQNQARKVLFRLPLRKFVYYFLQLYFCGRFSWCQQQLQFMRDNACRIRNSPKFAQEMAYFLVSSHSCTSVHFAWRHTANYAISCTNYRPYGVHFLVLARSRTSVRIVRQDAANYAPFKQNYPGNGILLGIFALTYVSTHRLATHGELCHFLCKL